MTNTTTNYIQTEIGLIPEDWKIVTLGEIGNFKNGVNKSLEDFGYGYPFANLMDVFAKSSIYSNNEFGLINSNEADRKLYNLIEGDTLFIRSSVKPSGVGLTSVIENNLDNTVFSGFIIRFRDNGTFEKKFKRHCFYNERFRNEIIASSTVSANTNINQEALKKIKIAFPDNKKEQTLIAEALSDTDNLITNLQNLINKKRQLKQAAMHQLLTPKEHWEVKKLGEIGETIIGLTYTPGDVVNEGKLVLRSSNVFGNKLVYDDCVFVSSQISERLTTIKSDILICVRNGSRNLIGKCAYIDGKAVGETFGAFMSIFRSQYNDFIFNLFQTNIIKKQIDEHLGATINQITNKSLNSFEIPFPPLNEQKQISTILFDMDKEIENLEIKLKKNQQLKKGMMQNLLTGKVRLV